jgi:predicted RNA polymerase sigma factor
VFRGHDGRRAIDRLRRAAVGATKLQELGTLAGHAGGGGGEAVDDADDDDQGAGSGRDVPHDRLRLTFTCCHPALPFDARVALTLRTLAGLTTRAFLVPEATMSRRLVRAKAKIREAGIPYRVPAAHLLPAGPRPCSGCSTCSSRRATRRRPVTTSCARACAARRSASPGCSAP